MSDLLEDLIWVPNPRQKEFLELPDAIFEALYGGAVFGGKSEVLLKYPIARRWIENGRFKGIVFRRSYPELEASLIRRTLEPDGYEKFGGKWNDNKHIWTFPSGAWIKLAFIERDTDARSYDTAEFNYIAFDQLEHFTEWQYTYLVSRCRSNDKSLPAVMRSAANPGGPGTAWVRERFVRPCPSGGKLLKDKLTGTYRIFIPAKLDDNIEGVKRDPGYKNRMLLLPEAERKAKLDGDWFALVGQAFPEFRTRKFPSEPENACHVIPPFTIPDYWPKIAAVDWGYSAKTAFLLGAVSPDDRLYIFSEFGVRKTKISTWATDVSRLTSKLTNFKKLYLDPSAWASRGDERTVQEQFTEHSGINPEKADNDRHGGKLLIHDMLRWTAKPTQIGREDEFDIKFYEDILRLKGVSDAKKYYESFLPLNQEDISSLPKLQIFNTCPQLIETIPICELDEHDPEDVEDFDGDDFYDCLRYIVKAYQLFLNESKKAHDKRVRLSEIETKLEKDGDYFSYHMQMLHLNKKNKNKKFGIRMFN